MLSSNICIDVYSVKTIILHLLISPLTEVAAMSTLISCTRSPLTDKIVSVQSLAVSAPSAPAAANPQAASKTAVISYNDQMIIIITIL